jgi:uncharacterized protein (DUF362 family)
MMMVQQFVKNVYTNVQHVQVVLNVALALMDVLLEEQIHLPKICVHAQMHNTNIIKNV